MITNIIQDVCLVLFLIAAFQVVHQRRHDVFGFVVKRQDKVVLDGSQGLTTLIGRVRTNDVVINKPDMPRKAAALSYDQSQKKVKVDQFSQKGRYDGSEYLIANQRFAIALPVNERFVTSGLPMIVFAIAFLGYKGYCLYQLFNQTGLLIAHALLIAYVIISYMIRTDHIPVIECIMAIFLTYYIEATMYPSIGAPDAVASCLRDVYIGVGIYIAMALSVSQLIKLDVNKMIGSRSVHQYLRILGAIGIVILIILNILLAKDKFGAYNWISIAGITFQPSELVKLIYLCVLVLPQQQLFNDKSNIAYTFGITSLVFAYAVLIKDSGLLVQLGCLFFIAVWLQNTNFLLIAIIILSAMVGAKLILKISSTAAYRITSWVGEGHSIMEILTGSGSLATHNGYGYQSVHALVAAFSNAGLLGNESFDALKGVLAANSDLVMGLMAQRHGSIWLFIMMLMFMLLIYTTFNVLQQQTRFQQVLTSLALAGIVFASVLNMGGTFSIIPLTGVVLPAISKGISAAFSYGGMFGILCASSLSKSYYQTINESGGITNE